jgi:hypothetical protein
MHKDLTPEQEQKLRQGCFYELCRFASTILLMFCIIYAMPLFGARIEFFLTTIAVCYAAYVTSEFLMGFAYPDRPLDNLKREIEREE